MGVRLRAASCGLRARDGLWQRLNLFSSFRRKPESSFMRLDSGFRRNDEDKSKRSAPFSCSRLAASSLQPVACGGFTLIELIITIVVLGIAVTGIMLAYTNIIVKSADPLLRVQSAAIAQAYLDEISLRPIADPDSTNSGENRSTYDNIADYNGLSEVPTDQTGNQIGGLGSYTVAVTTTSGVNVGVPPNDVPMTQIQVTVTDPSGSALTLVGYRADY